MDLPQNAAPPEGSGEGWNFFSPNTQDHQMSFEQAYQGLQTPNHAAFRDIAKDIMKAAGVKDYESHDAVGDTEQWGAEPSFLHIIKEPLHPNLSKYLGNWLGLLGNQKAVLHFTTGEGPDAIYQVYIPDTPAAELREQLSKYGITYRTILPKGNGHVVAIYDKGKALRSNVGAFAGEHNAIVREAIGRGEYLGDPAGDSRSTAREHYRDGIRTFEKDHGTSKVRSGSLEGFDATDAGSKDDVTSQLAEKFNAAFRRTPLRLSVTPEGFAGPQAGEVKEQEASQRTQERSQGLQGVSDAPRSRRDSATPGDGPNPLSGPSELPQKPTLPEASRPRWWFTKDVRPELSKVSSKEAIHPNVHSAVSAWLGSRGAETDPEDTSALLGLVPGSKVEFIPAHEAHGQPGAMTVVIQHPNIEGALTLKYGQGTIKAGNSRTKEVPELWVEHLHAKETSKGWSLRLVAHQIAAAKRLGVQRIKCIGGRDPQAQDLEGSGTMNAVGYNIWPKFGYDGPIPLKTQEALKGLGEPYTKASTIQHLLSMPHGDKIWKEHGATAPMVFNVGFRGEYEEPLSVQILHHQMEHFDRLFSRRRPIRQAARAPEGGFVDRGVPYKGGQILPKPMPSPSPVTPQTPAPQPVAPQPPPKPKVEVPIAPPVNPLHQDPEFQKNYKAVSQKFADHLSQHPSLTPEHVKTYTQVAHKVWQKMPTEALSRITSNVESYSFYPTIAALTESIHKDYGPWLRDNGWSPQSFFGGMYDTLGGLRLAGDNPEALRTPKTARGIYAHEFTHAIDGLRREISSSPAWHWAFVAELKDGQLNDYAATQRHEGLAEFGRLVYTSETPEELEIHARAFPKCTAVFKQRSIWPTFPTSSPSPSPSQGEGLVTPSKTTNLQRGAHLGRTSPQPPR